MTFDELSKTLQFIRPNAEWALRGETLDDLEWLDSKQNKPTESEINEGYNQYKIWKTEQEADAQAKRAAAEAKLAALGLTADDLKALGLA